MEWRVESADVVWDCVWVGLTRMIRRKFARSRVCVELVCSAASRETHSLPLSLAMQRSQPPLVEPQLQTRQSPRGEITPNFRRCPKVQTLVARARRPLRTHEVDLFIFIQNQQQQLNANLKNAPVVAKDAVRASRDAAHAARESEQVCNELLIAGLEVRQQAVLAAVAAAAEAAASREQRGIFPL